MAYKVIMPKAGMAMETGKIVRWLKNEGDRVEAGEFLLEIETDKVNMEVEAMNTGVLLKITAHEGDEVPVVQTIGYIGEAGEAVPEEETGDKPEVAEQKEREVAQRREPLTAAGEKIPATPAAKRIAREIGIALSNVTPNGSRGQIKAADVEAAGEIKAVNPRMVKPETDTTDAAPVMTGEDTMVPHPAMRRVIAKRMLQSHLEIPPVTQSCIADVTGLVALKEQINAGDAHVSLNDFIIMAVAKALREQPRINAQYTDEGLILKKHVNVGVAVALPEGLIVPVIRDADTLTLRQISGRAKDFAARAREGRLAPDEYADGTFTISNLGMLGVTSFTPIINQPEIAILGVCAARQTLATDENGDILKRMMMELPLTYDHRCIDGAQAALFSNRVAELLQNPLLMLAAGQR